MSAVDQPQQHSITMDEADDDRRSFRSNTNIIARQHSSQIYDETEHFVLPGQHQYSEFDVVQVFWVA
jgi:hypothetical protein